MASGKMQKFRSIGSAHPCFQGEQKASGSARTSPKRLNSACPELLHHGGDVLIPTALSFAAKDRYEMHLM